MADNNATQVANLVAQPRVMNSAIVSHGRVRSKVEKVTLAGAQSDADTWRFFRVGSGDRIISLELSCDALTGFTSADFGLYNIEGGAEADDDLFDSAQTLAVALYRQEKRFGLNSALNHDTLGQRVYELLGLSDDPHLTYDVTMLGNTVGSASGDITLEMTYVSGD